MRTESDSRGKSEVAADRYRGAQTQRSLQNFKIGGDRFTRPAIPALGLVEKAVALVNLDLKTIPADDGALILRAADEVIEGRLDDHFPPSPSFACASNPVEVVH